MSESQELITASRFQIQLNMGETSPFPNLILREGEDAARAYRRKTAWGRTVVF